MSGLGAVFVELVRRAAIGKGSSWRGYCEMCGRETVYVLVAENSTMEVYKCGHCGATKAYSVR